VLYGVSVERAVRYIPLKSDAFGDGFEAMLFNGLLAAAGVVLVVPLFVPSRWRSPTSPANQADQSGAGRYSPSESTTTLLADEWDRTATYPNLNADPPASDPYNQ
jgi:hypothetical protein